MKNPLSRGSRYLALASLTAAVGLAGAGALRAECGPFADVGLGPPNFCPFVLQLYYLGITAGTSATTYSPATAIPREQMSAFIARGFDQAVRRGSPRAALDQWWSPQNELAMGATPISDAEAVASDGADLWVARGFPTHRVTRVRASDGQPLGTWDGAIRATAVVVAMGRIFVAGNTNPGTLYRIDPTLPAGDVTTVAADLGEFPLDVAFDGSRFWTANSEGSVSIVTPAASLPWPATTVTAGFDFPFGIAFDGRNIWVADADVGLLKLDADGAVVQTVPIATPVSVVFDGANLWVPNNVSELTVVRASTGVILETLTGNGLDGVEGVAFDGQRILVANREGRSVSLWKAADLTPLGSFPTGAASQPRGVCSDGLHFWIAADSAGLIRF
jgi:hypothetical protein